MVTPTKAWIRFESSVKDNHSPKYKMYSTAEVDNLVKDILETMPAEKELHPLEIKHELEYIPQGIQCDVAGSYIVKAIKAYE